jgi:WhiB family redox-sensing transcriptional regulator
MGDWRDKALCKGKHHDLWFPPFPGERQHPENLYYEVGKMVCEHCPVMSECTVAGAEEEWGLWGGETPRERQGLDEYRPPVFALMARYVDKVPAHFPGRLDLQETLVNLKRYSDRRE